MNLMLDPAIVTDDDELAEVVGEFVRQDHDAGERQKEIDHLEEEFRVFFADEGAWQEYVNLGELRDAQHADLLVNVARWAFEEGRGHPLIPEDPGY